MVLVFAVLLVLKAINVSDFLLLLGTNATALIVCHMTRVQYCYLLQT